MKNRFQELGYLDLEFFIHDEYVNLSKIYDTKTMPHD